MPLSSLPELVSTSFPNSTPRSASIRSAISCNFLAFALHDDHLQAVVMIEVDMRGGKNHCPC